MPAKKSAKKPAMAWDVNPPPLQPGAPLIVTPPLVPIPLDPTGDVPSAEALALRAKEAAKAEAIKSGIAQRLAQQSIEQAREEAARLAAVEETEIEAAIVAGVAEQAKIASAARAKAKRKADKGESLRVAAAENFQIFNRLASAENVIVDESSDDDALVGFIPPPASAHELAAKGNLAKSKKAKLPKPDGVPSAEDVAALKAIVDQKERSKEFALLQRRDAVLSGGNDFVDPLAADANGLYFARLSYSYIPFPSSSEAKTEWRFRV